MFSGADSTRFSRSDSMSTPQCIRRCSSTSTDSTISSSSISSDSMSLCSAGSKRVRFSRRPKVNVFYKVDAATCEEDSLWWSAQHCMDNRIKAAQEGERWMEKGFGILLQDTYKNQDDRDKLDTYVQLPGEDYIRGLEAYACPKLQQERKIARKTLIQTIVTTEVELKIAKNYTPEEVAEELAELSRDLSEKARSFAKRMGQADELGDKLGENPELPFYILQSAAPKASGSLTVSIGSSLGRLVTSVATALGA